MAFIVDSAKRLLCSLTPSYLQVRDHGGEDTSSKRRPTSALDGLRGIAALFIFFFHVLFAYTDLVEYGYGHEHGQSSMIQLPILRLFLSGHAMVTLFFVVGGYVFSIKPLRMIRSGQSARLLEHLASSIFRRAIRFYAPAVIATFITMLTLYAGLWEAPRRYFRPDRSIIWYADHHMDRAGTFGKQFLHWLHQTMLLTNVFNYYNQGALLPYYPAYDPHLWTIPVEYRSSLLLTLCLLGLSQCRSASRLLLLGAATVFCVMWDRWELVCFIAGAVLCEIDLATHSFQDKNASLLRIKDDKEVLPSYSDPAYQAAAAASRTSTPRSQWPYYLLCTAGLYLLSAPPLDPANTPGYSLLPYLTPPTYTDPKRWPYTLGALMLIAALGRAPTLRRPLESALAQYLGKISFSLYIVHGPLIHIVGYRVTPWIWLHVTGMQGCGWAGGLVMGTAVLAVVVALVADWFWRVVEGASLDWARRFEEWCRAERNDYT